MTSQVYGTAEAAVERAAKAAAAVAAEHGLKFSGVRLIGGYSNTLIQLIPLPLVARVATVTGTVRRGYDWMAREVAVAGELASDGARVARPSDLLPPGPYVRDGLALTFWEYLAITPGSLPPDHAGAALRKLHEALVRCTVPVPRLGPIDEAFGLLARAELLAKLQNGEGSAVVARSLDRVRHALDGRSLTCRPLHGDAHHGNLWRVSGEAVWATSRTRAPDQLSGTSPASLPRPKYWARGERRPTRSKVTVQRSTATFLTS